MLTPVQADHIDRTREVSSPDDNELHQTIFALSGIFDALDWIDDKFLAERVEDKAVETARTHLILAGKLLCERTAERF